MHHIFLYISLPVFARLRRENAYFRVLWSTETSNGEILFLFLHLDMVPRNSTPGGFTYIRQSKWVGIIAIKTERTQIHFLNDVLIAVASLDIKVPIGAGRRETDTGNKIEKRLLTKMK